MPNPKTRDKLSSVDTGKSFSGLMAHRQSASFRAVYQKRLTEKNINESNKIELNDNTTTSTVQQDLIKKQKSGQKIKNWKVKAPAKTEKQQVIFKKGGYTVYLRKKKHRIRVAYLFCSQVSLMSPRRMKHRMMQSNSLFGILYLV